MKNYTVFVDGISKAFAATGVRVGWSMGPEALISKMKAINSHVGSWAPLAEQKATARFLQNETAVDEFLNYFKGEVSYRLTNLYKGFKQLQSEGFAVDAIEPEAAIYLTVKIDLKGKMTHEGLLIDKQERVTEYVLNKAKLALVPFGYFGADKESSWYRISVGCCKKEEIVDVIANLREALKQLV
jgi:aspartate aminotransferase